MKYVAMIQARYGSSRLRGKILMDLGGKPVLQRVIERVRKSKYIQEVMVVTSMDRNNLPVLRLCADLGIRVFAGAENDVLDRFYQCARLIEPDYIVRVTADCPCYDWMLLDQAIEAMKPDTDYLWDSEHTLPDGLDLEITRYTMLRQTWNDARLASEREHVTLYLRNHPEIFKCQTFTCPIEGISHLRLTLDEAEDYALLQKIYQHFLKKGREDFLIQDILEYLRENPALEKINDKYTRDEGLAKSLREDYLVR